MTLMIHQAFYYTRPTMLEDESKHRWSCSNYNLA